MSPLISIFDFLIGSVTSYDPESLPEFDVAQSIEQEEKTVAVVDILEVFDSDDTVLVKQEQNAGEPVERALTNTVDHVSQRVPLSAVTNLGDDKVPQYFETILTNQLRFYGREKLFQYFQMDTTGEERDDILKTITKLTVRGLSDVKITPRDALFVTQGTGEFKNMLPFNKHLVIGDDGSKRFVVLQEESEFIEFEQFGPGFCYLNLIEKSKRALVASELGNRTSATDLLGLSMDKFVSIDDLRQFGVRGDSTHVEVVRYGGYPLILFLNFCAQIHVLAEPENSLFSTVLGCGNIPMALFQHLYGFANIYTLVGGHSSLYAYLEHHLKSFGCVLTNDRAADVRTISMSSGMLGAESKRYIRMLEFCGDAAFTHAIARQTCKDQATVQEAQEFRSSKVSNTKLSVIFANNFDIAWFTFPSGVNPAIGNVGAKFVEVILGFVDYYYGFDAAIKFVQLWNIL